MEGATWPAALATALILDLALGEPRGPLLKLHPVVLCGSIASRLVKKGGSRVYGIALWMAAVIPVLAAYATAAALATEHLGSAAAILISAIILKLCMPIRMLVDIARNAYSAMRRGNWREARAWAQHLVRRDVYRLDEEHVISAVIESLAESCVDGITSPMLHFSTMGILGALLQRLANTMDSVVGYLTPELRNQGWFSAKLDTLLNYLPARLTAALIILSAMVLRLNWRNGVSVVARFARATPSVNAGWPMAAMAGVLGVQLIKPGYYVLGVPHEPLTPHKIVDAIRVVLVTVAFSAAISAGLMLAISSALAANGYYHVAGVLSVLFS